MGFYKLRQTPWIWVLETRETGGISLKGRVDALGHMLESKNSFTMLGYFEDMYKVILISTTEF